MTPKNTEQPNILQQPNILLTNIQRFSLHDGPGIRTTVFLKGCSIHCPWCSNPENLLHREQRYVKKDREGRVEEEGVYGKWYTADELYKEVVKDKAFYGSCGSGCVDNGRNASIEEKASCGSGCESNGGIELEALPGGVTFSGGECMLQMPNLEPLLQTLNQNHIHTAVETSLFCTPSQLSIAINHIDLFYVDIKFLDDGLCSSVLGGRLSTYKQNLETLLNSSKPVVFRVPVIGGYTDYEENRRKVVELIKECVGKHTNIKKVELLKEHNLGTNKYQSLLDGGNEIALPEYSGIDDSLMERYKQEIEDGIGELIPVEVCKI